MHIGAYQVLVELGRGGMGTVYLGRLMCEGGVERLVAIKRAHRRESSEQSQRFLNEARLTAHVHHANVVGMHQAGSDEDGHYLIFDYVEGESLAGLIERVFPRARLPVPILVRVMIDALAGLHAAHETVDLSGRALGMLHRDVSVENLLVGRDGVTRLADFGIAKSVLSSVQTEEGIVHGKLLYLSPEYLRREPVDRTVDVYAMGVTLWIALAGHLPFLDLGGPHVMQAILDQGIPRLSDEGVQIDPGLEDIVATALHRDPRQRYQSARQMLAALEAYGKQHDAIATHTTVSEFVEQTVGGTLATRREKIKARRTELDRLTLLASLPDRSGELSASMLAHTQPEPITTSGVAVPQPRAPSRQAPSNPGAAAKPAPVPAVATPGGASLAHGAHSERVSSTPPPGRVSEVVQLSRFVVRRPWLLYAVMLVLGLSVGYGVFVSPSSKAKTSPPVALSAPAQARHTGAAQPVEAVDVAAPKVAPVESPPPSAVVPAAKPVAKKRARPDNEGRSISTKNPYL
jgi:serine/threonine protein kinase